MDNKTTTATLRSRRRLQAPPPPRRIAPVEDPNRYWFARHSKSIIFLILTLAVVGIYEAFTLPIAVFPTTNFPRIIIGVDNGVMPINQMEVTITRPIEEAVNSVPGLQDVRSITSRGSAEIDLVFRLGRGHGADAPAGEIRDVANPEHAAFDGSNRDAIGSILRAFRFWVTASRRTRFPRRSFGSWPPMISSRG